MHATDIYAIDMKALIPMDLMQEDMERLPFVTWDRFVLGDNKVEMYGWIEREQDSYKDCVWIEYRATPANKRGFWTWDSSYGTTSAKYSKIIFDLLQCEGKHFLCNRIEDYFDVENMVKR